MAAINVAHSEESSVLARLQEKVRQAVAEKLAKAKGLDPAIVRECVNKNSVTEMKSCIEAIK